MPIRVRALAIEITTLPRRWPSTCWAVWVAPSHGVAITTRSASAAPSLSAASMVSSRPAHCSFRPSTTSRARYRDREPMTVSKPTDASRAASALPAGPVPPRIPMRIGDTVAARVLERKESGRPP